MACIMENLNQVEAGILLWIQENLRTEWLDHIMPYVSKINDHGILAIIGVIVNCYCGQDIVKWAFHSIWFIGSGIYNCQPC